MVMMAMVMAAVFVVDMVVIMIVLVMMVVMNLSAMPHFIVLMMPACVSTRLGFERSLARRYLRAKLLQHFFEDMVFSDAQEPLADFNRHVPVSKVVSDSGKIARRVRLDMKNFFFLGNNYHNSAVRSGDQIPSAQDLAARQHQPDVFTGHEFCLEPAFLPQLERQPELTAYVDLVRSSGYFEFCFYL